MVKVTNQNKSVLIKFTGSDNHINLSLVNTPNTPMLSVDGKDNIKALIDGLYTEHTFYVYSGKDTFFQISVFNQMVDVIEYPIPNDGKKQYSQSEMRDASTKQFEIGRCLGCYITSNIEFGGLLKRLYYTLLKKMGK